MNVKHGLKNPYVIAAIAGMITLPLLRPCLRHIPEPPPVISEVPEFELINQDGEPFGSTELSGHVYITSFFFTTCPSICPQITTAMASVQEELGADTDIKLVSISVDPATDTPERIREYGVEYGADFDRWTFLTGPRETIVSIALDGFLSAVGTPTETEPGVMDITHAGRLFIVDGKGRVRGTGYSADESGVDEVLHRAHHVLREQEEQE